MVSVISYKVCKDFPRPEPQSDAIREGEMKAHLQVIFALDELAAYSESRQTDALSARRAWGNYGFQGGRDVAVSSK